MKQIELELKKKILIIESDELALSKEGIIYKDSNDHLSDLIEGKFHCICPGSELTEEISETLISKNDVRKLQSKMCGLKFKEGLIKMIESQGYYWGENTLGDYNNVIKRHIVTGTWQQYQDKTFDLNKTLIFEIL